MPTVREIPPLHGDMAYELFNEAETDQSYFTTMSFAKATAPTIAELNGILGNFHDTLSPRISAEYQILSVSTLYQPATGPQIRTDSDRAPEVFTGIGTASTQNTAVLVQKKTGFAGRAFRGRMYIPGIPEGDVDGGGRMLIGVETGWQTSMSDHFAFISLSMTPVLIHSCFHEPEDPVCVPPEPTTVTSLDVQGLMATQRRRLR